ncbi:MAG: cyclic nucleotide-binding domain-containing protein [Deltaproteobacteria bacterium]|nr:cyclic nucleotide-binding domain-containing protein [Deltaproteobacteria bacterium]MBW2633196.1 cyclic nucleotide-binding domain-containing protein [Deltaproteobacteria bacterium]
MVTIEDLKEIILMTHLEDDMLTRVCAVVDVLSFHDQEVIFRQGDVSDRFYMVKRGKVLLEQAMTDLVTVSVGSIKPGYSFGWSTMIEEGHYTTDAVCAEPCEIFSIRGSQLRDLCAQEPHMGYLLSQRLLVILKKRYDHRTEQFLKVIQHHPDMEGMFKIE